jgi:lactate dehydrogenase-like 2-hydroxyacid dehydrogenase
MIPVLTTTATKMPIKVFYTAYATTDVYDVIRGAMPPNVELVTLTADSDEERRTKIGACEIAIMAITRLSDELLTAGACLKLVVHLGVGYQDTVDLEALRARGIRLAVTPGGTITSVAEHTVLMMLAACRRLPYADRELRAGRFHVQALRPVSRELRGKRIGFIGMGRIGQEVAERLLGFSTTCVYFTDRNRLDPAREAYLRLERVTFEQLLSESDVITLHLPLSPQTRDLIDAVAIRQMKRGVILINTARGGLVNEEALADALESGHILAAALDVFATEPYPLGTRLAGLNNVVLTPHIAAGTLDALQEKMRSIADNITRFCAGEVLHDEVTLEAR